MVIFHSYVSLPEGIPLIIQKPQPPKDLAEFLLSSSESLACFWIKVKFFSIPSCFAMSRRKVVVDTVLPGQLARFPQGNLGHSLG